MRYVLQYSFAIDGEGCLVRNITVTPTGTHVDPTSDKLNTSAQCPEAAATKQIDYMMVRPDRVVPPLLGVASPVL